MKIDRNVPIPLYYQLQQHFLKMIKNKELNVGDRVPSEEEIIKESGLSRFTVRQALQALEREGRVTRIRGRGTFVSEVKVPLSVAWQLLGFSEDMTRKGYKVESRILEQSLVPAPADAADELGIKVKAPTIFVKRFRLLDGSPMLVDMIYIRADICDGLEKVDMENSSLFAILEKSCGHSVMSSKRTLSIDIARAEIARLLEIKSGTAVFLLQDLAFMKNGQKIFYAKTYINETRSEFIFELNRSVTRGDQSSTSEGSTYPGPKRKKK